MKLTDMCVCVVFICERTALLKSKCICERKSDVLLALMLCLSGFMFWNYNDLGYQTDKIHGQNNYITNLDQKMFFYNNRNALIWTLIKCKI